MPFGCEPGFPGYGLTASAADMLAAPLAALRLNFVVKVHGILLPRIIARNGFYFADVPVAASTAGAILRRRSSEGSREAKEKAARANCSRRLLGSLPFG